MPSSHDSGHDDLVRQVRDLRGRLDAAEHALRTAADDAESGRREQVERDLRLCYEIFANSVEGIASIDRRRTDSHLRLVGELSAALGPAVSSDDIVTMAGRLIARHVGATRVNFSDVSPDGDTLHVFASVSDDGLEDDRITHRLSDYLAPDAIEVLKNGRVVSVDDVAGDPRTAGHADAYAQWRIGSMVLAPYVSDGRWRFHMAVHKSVPYRWRPDEVEMLGEVANRVYLRLERARAEDALRAAHATFHHLVEHSPFGIYAVNADFRLVLVSAGAQKVFENVRPLIGRDFGEVLRIIWPEPFASEAIGRFRHTLDTGEAYHAPSTVEQRNDTGSVESYDWKIERVLLPDGRPGVVCHFYDLSERQQHEAALREADRQKDEFLAMLAHELRNPLAPIRTAVSLLQAKAPGDQAVTRALQVVARQSAQLARLLDDLLDVARLSRGDVGILKSIVPFADVIEAAIETSRPLITQRGQYLELRGTSAGIFVDGDATRLTQVFANLLNNASKYSWPGGRIELAVEACGDTVAVRVRDHGIGIETPMLSQVFDLFAQSAQARSHAPGGLGVGLSLARRLVELHGGRITAESAGPGTGSEFRVVLPVVAEVLPLHEAATTNAAGAAGRRVLVVDDNQDAADTVTALLRHAGCDVHAAYDGPSAVAAAAGFAPDVVLLDLGMPGQDGYETCRQLRAVPATRGVRIVAVSGWGQRDDVTRTAEAGFDGHLVKPVDPAVLVRVVAEAGTARPEGSTADSPVKARPTA